MRKAILHIGLEKTGSSALQEFLWINRRILLDRYQVWTPDYLGRGSQWLLAVLAYDTAREDDLTSGLGSPASRRDKLEEVRKKITYSVNHQPAKQFCFSSEHLSSRLVSTEDICRLKVFLSELFDDIEVVVYVREPIRMAISRQSTAVKLGYGFLGLPEPSQIAETLDFKQIIQRWESVFGKCLRIRLYDEGAREFDIISDFQSLIDLSSPIDSNVIRPGRINSSLSWSHLRLMSGINAAAHKRLGRPLPSSILRRIVNVLEEVVPNYSVQSKPFKATKEEVDSYERYFSSQNSWLFNTYFPDRPFQWNSSSSAITIDFLDDSAIELSSSEEVLCQLLVGLFVTAAIDWVDIAEHLSQMAWKIQRQEPLNLHDQEVSERFSAEIKSALSKGLSGSM